MSSARTLRGGTAKNHMFSIPKGLSLRLFDTPAKPSNLFSSALKVGTLSCSSGSDSRPRSTTQVSSSASKFISSLQDTAAHPANGQYRQDSVFDNAYGRKASANSRGYAIYPGNSRYTYIYVPSVSSKSDLSDQLGDAGVDSVLSFPGDVSSIRASSSMETLQSSGAAAEIFPDESFADLPSSTHPPQRVVPIDLPALIEAQNTANAGIINVSLPEGPPSDSESDSTVTGKSYGQRAHSVPSATSTLEPRQIVPATTFASHSTGPAIPRRRDLSGNSQSTYERQVFPPGLSSSPPVSPTIDNQPDPRMFPPSHRRERRESFSVPSSRPSDPAQTTGNSTEATVLPWGPQSSSVSTGPATQRNGTLSDQNRRTMPPTSSSLSSSNRAQQTEIRTIRSGQTDAPPSGALIRPQPAVNTRCVRWNENLICPSPIPFHERRKGWFNRRGDQLWTNVGAYKSAPQGQEYPPDLQHYPDYGVGWMNEEGVRIDMQHRLVPKAPLRSALKRQDHA